MLEDRGSRRAVLTDPPSCRRTPDPDRLELGDGGVYVGAATELSSWKDTDGDGRGRTPVVLSGFGTGDAHQTLNSSPGVPAANPDEPGIACEFPGGNPPWGIAEPGRRASGDSGAAAAPRCVLGWRHGEPTIPSATSSTDGDNPSSSRATGTASITHPGHDPHRSFPGAEGPLESGTEVRWCRRRENRICPPQQGSLVAGGYLQNTVERFRVTDDGSTFRVERLAPADRNSDTSFRIVDVRFGPDGALYRDQANPVIGITRPASAIRPGQNPRTHLAHRAETVGPRTAPDSDEHAGHRRTGGSRIPGPLDPADGAPCPGGTPSRRRVRRDHLVAQPRRNRSFRSAPFRDPRGSDRPRSGPNQPPADARRRQHLRPSAYAARVLGIGRNAHPQRRRRPNRHSASLS